MIKTNLIFLITFLPISGFSQGQMQWSNSIGVYKESIANPTQLSYSDFTLYAAEPEVIEEYVVVADRNGGAVYGGNRPLRGLGINTYFQKSLKDTLLTLKLELGFYSSTQRSSSYQIRTDAVYFPKLDTTISDYSVAMSSTRGLVALNSNLLIFKDLNKRFKAYVGVGLSVGYSTRSKFVIHYISKLDSTIAPNGDVLRDPTSKFIIVQGQPIIYGRVNFPLGINYQLTQRIQIFLQSGFMVGMEHVINRKTYVFPRVSPLAFGMIFIPKKKEK